MEPGQIVMRSDGIPAAPDAAQITLREVCIGDREFLLSVYAAGREIELSMVPWVAAQRRVFVEHQFDAQNLHYRTYYEGSTHEIILFDGVPAGRLYLSRADQIAILDIAVLPEFRNRGIGTAVIRRLRDEATRSNLSLRIYMESYNPFQILFTELGFEVVQDDGVMRQFVWSMAHRA